MWFNTSIRSGVSWRSSEARLMTSTTADPKRFFFPAYFDILLFMWLLACPLSGEHVNEAPILWYLFLIYIPFLSIRELCLFRNINYFFILIFKNFKPRICQLYIFFWQKINTRIGSVAAVAAFIFYLKSSSVWSACCRVQIFYYCPDAGSLPLLWS